MREYGQWSSWTLRIGDKIYKNVKPLTLELINNDSTWSIVFTYNRGPLTFTQKDSITFSTEGKARGWFDYVYSGLFLDDPSVSEPKSKRITCRLSIVKDTL